MAASLPGLAALLALLFTWMQVTQTGKEVGISEQGQITNRFNAAINNLGSTSLDIRLGGIYALERIMHDSARDQPAVISVLSAYLRQHASVPVGSTKKAPGESGDKPSPRADVQAVMTVLGNRSPDRDQGAPIDLSRTALRGVRLPGDPTEIPFRGADLSNADLRDSSLPNADLREASLIRANLSGAALRGSRLDLAYLTNANLADVDLSGSHLNGAGLEGANLTGASFCSEVFMQTAQGGRGAAAALLSRARPVGQTRPEGCADLADALLVKANLTNAALFGMNLTRTMFCPPPEPGFDSGDCANLTGATLSESNLKGAYLSRANLRGADLAHADLTGADLTNADLTNADLTGAKVAGAKFEGAKLKGVRGLPPSL
ncbi:pentapeptide repeat-containing protein [Streptomyces sp. NPDC088253]|uniref:pentapeptide repeat-containing protein n=1 Tax=Streptomyces sp. NPDC088253 TaxID=3365846 RepID=UPI0037FF2229